MKPLIWIIDEEWPDYEVETELLKKRFPEGEIRYSTYDYEADLNEFGYQADIILAQVYASLPKTMLERLTNCRGIAIYGGGFDRVDVETAKKLGIKVTNVQGYCAEDLADYVMAAIFNHNKDLTGYQGVEKSGDWGALAVRHNYHRISASTLLVVGCGTIGKSVAGKARALGMRVLGYEPNRSAQELAQAGIGKVTWEEGLALADYISVNVRLTEKTAGMISMEDFKQMKPTVYLINTARGGLIVEQDLIRACREGVIAGACVDVIAHEPPAGDEEIFSCENIIVTPHISYISEESFRTLKERTANNAICMYEGGEPADWVNP